MATDKLARKRTWSAKFRDAFRGIWFGTQGESSFVVHLAVAVAVLGAACYFRVGASEWCLLILCITAVLVCELFNSALEHLAQAVDTEFNRHIGRALDIASGAVLVAALGASAVGIVILLPRLIGY